jgi:hypothetical protein
VRGGGEIRRRDQARWGERETEGHGEKEREWQENR